MRVAVALSGGVDSSVAAALLVQQGHDVVGVTLQQWPRGDAAELERHGGCCSLDAVEDARRVATQLGIPFYCWNLESEFGERVIEPFHRAYLAGETPNPCLRCNTFVRFDLMLGRVRALGFDRLATGHYARVLEGPGGWELHAGLDPAKDQSYMLSGIDPEVLGSLLFPLGDLSKPRTRELARGFGLPVAEKAESQEICFIPRGQTSAYLAARLPVSAGEVVGEDGRTLGSHRGAALYTVGQRTGLGDLVEPGPWFVLRVEAGANRVVVGRRERLATSSVALREVRWLADGARVAFEGGSAVPCSARLRYRSAALPGRVEREPDGGPGGARLLLDEPFMGAAPGQAAVLYDGSRVLGGATITS